MQSSERRATFSIASIMGFRMLGLFMILPVFSLYADHLPGATPTLIGLALGIYGLTQAGLQLPFGSLSDRFGRKRIISIGLCLFATGSAVAALSHSIYGIIFGRALQGAGAIGSSLLAMVADVTQDENRSKAMAFIGLAIGGSFSLAMIFGPLINQLWGLTGIFWVTMALALVSLVLLHTTVPNHKPLFHPTVEANSKGLKAIFHNPQLLRLDLGIFTLHAMLTACFIAIPLVLANVLQLTASQQTWLYLTVLSVAFLLSLPCIIISEKKRLLKPMFLAAIAILIGVMLLLTVGYHSRGLAITLLLLFFTAFTFLEASLPSLVSKLSPIKRRGAAMGVYSTSQFLGIFVGGSLGGWVFSQFHILGIFVFCALLGLTWLTIAYSMSEPPYLSTVILPVNDKAVSNFASLSQQLLRQPGVAEIALMSAERLAYAKIDKSVISKDELRNWLDKSTLGT